MTVFEPLKRALKRFSSMLTIAGLVLLAACGGSPSQTGSAADSSTPLAEITPAVLPPTGAGTLPAASASPAVTAASTDTAAPRPTARPVATAAPTDTAAPSPTTRPSATATATRSAPVAQAPQGRPTPTPSSEHQAFIDSIVPYAQAEQADSGVPASFSLALAASETGWGVSPLMKQANNYANIACSKPNEGLPCVAYGNGMWNAYSSPEQGFLWAGRWLRGNSVFAPAFQHTDDVATFTRLVATCYVSCSGPFPQPFYDGIMNMIDQYNLRQYDRPAGK